MLLANAAGAPVTPAASPSGPPSVLFAADNACSEASQGGAPGRSAATEMQHLAVAWRASYKR